MYHSPLPTYSDTLHSFIPPTQQHYCKTHILPDPMWVLNTLAPIVKMREHIPFTHPSILHLCGSAQKAHTQHESQEVLNTACLPPNLSTNKGPKIYIP